MDESEGTTAVEADVPKGDASPEQAVTPRIEVVEESKPNPSLFADDASDASDDSMFLNCEPPSPKAVEVLKKETLVGIPFTRRFVGSSPLGSP